MIIDKYKEYVSNREIVINDKYKGMKLNYAEPAVLYRTQLKAKKVEFFMDCVINFV